MFKRLNYPKSAFHIGILFVLLVAFFLLIFFLWGWVDDIALRLIATPEQNSHVFHIAMRYAAGICTAVLIWLHFRYASALGERKWWSMFVTYIVGIALAFFAVSAIADSTIKGIVVQRAWQPAVVQATVVKTGIHRGRTTDLDYAEVQTAAGQRLSLQSYKGSLYSALTGYAVRVNGQCKVNTLPVGTLVTLYGRDSNLGFVLDKVTSTKPCS